jgi:D-alanine transaminase
MHTLPSFPCYLNGTYTPLCDAKISVMDRGFIFGDGVYEVVPVYAGRPFRFSQHMARLDRSLAELRIANPLTRAEWHDIATKLIAGLADHACASGLNSLNPNHLVYLQITRGVALRDHAMPQDITPTVFAMATQMNLPNASQRSQGVACVTADDFRWEKAHIKSTSLLGAVFARQIGVDAGVAETVMFRNGYLSEAASSNVWLVQDGCLIGPPKNSAAPRASRLHCAASPATKSCMPTNCCSPAPPKKCWPSPRWTAKRSATACPARSTPNSTRPTPPPPKPSETPHLPTHSHYDHPHHRRHRSPQRLADRVPLAVPHQSHG